MLDRRSVLIAGAGGIGRAAALMLLEWADFPLGKLYLVDASPDQLADAMDFLGEDEHTVGVLASEGIHDAENVALAAAFSLSDVVLDCLPGAFAPQVAARAIEAGAHYANLTEYVAETEQIEALAEGAEVGLVLQTGLAPGFINVLAMKLYGDFCARYGSEAARSIAMRVGALTPEAGPPHYYGFTWSPIGVATEYLQPSVVVRDGVIGEAPSLSDRETLVIEGVTYEADLTSGGAANLPDYFTRDGHQIEQLDYKTLRHPGHYAWVEGLLEELGSEDPRLLQKRMQDEVPMMEDDRVVVYAAVRGVDAAGQPVEVAKHYVIEPIEVGGRPLKAIQATTAAPLVEAARMLLTGAHHGVVHQSDIDPEAFLGGLFVRKVYGDPA